MNKKNIKILFSVALAAAFIAMGTATGDSGSDSGKSNKSHETKETEDLQEKEIPEESQIEMVNSFDDDYVPSPEEEIVLITNSAEEEDIELIEEPLPEELESNHTSDE